MAKFQRLILGLVLALGVMAQGAATVMVNNFTGGEVSPLVDVRADVDKYLTCSSTMENMVPLVQGPAVRRPGSRYVAATKDNDVARLISWYYASGDAYCIEMGDEYLRFYRSHGQVLDANSVPYEIASPYDGNEIERVQYVQSADVCYLCDPCHMPYELVRSTHISWTLEDANIIDGPFLTENITDVNITPSATTGTITLTASSAVFDGNHVGALWRIRQVVDQNDATGTFTATGDGNDVTISEGQGWEVVLSGTWDAEVQVQYSLDGDLWLTYSTCTENERIVGENDEDQAILFRVSCTAYDSGTVTWHLYSLPYMHIGVVRITEVDSNTVADANVMTALYDVNSTTYWSEGAWSTYRGFPEAIGTYADRVVYACTTHQPTTLWFSATGKYDSFQAGTAADDSFAFTLSVAQQNHIRWLAIPERRGMIVGTSGNILELQPYDATIAIRPDNPPVINSRVSVPCSTVAAVDADNAVLCVQRGGRKIREIVYDYESDSVASPDLTLLAEHITKGGIKAVAWQSRPYPILWCVRDDGEVPTMSYDRVNGIAAWARQVTDGNVESVTVIYGNDEEDEVWWLVNRDIDGNDVRYVEYISAWDWGDDQNDCHFVDSGVSWDGGVPVDVLAVTKANPGVVTLSTWPELGTGVDLADGNQIYFEGLGGMTELNGLVFSVHDPNVTAKTFKLRNSADTADWNTTGYTTFTTGGTCRIVEKDFSGASHLAGATIDCLADTSTVADVNVTAGGAINLDDFVGDVHAGLPYDSIIESVRLDLMSDKGLTRTRVKQIKRAGISLFQTWGPSMGPDVNHLKEIPLRKAWDPLTTNPLYTGEENVSFDGTMTSNCRIYILQDQPMPMTVRAVIPALEVLD